MPIYLPDPPQQPKPGEDWHEWAGRVAEWMAWVKGALIEQIPLPPVIPPPYVPPVPNVIPAPPPANASPPGRVKILASESWGVGSYTTDANGNLTIPHMLPSNPTWANCSVEQQGNPWGGYINNWDATNLYIYVMNTRNGANIANTTLLVTWRAIL
jgi:hypothetical protein